MRELSDLAKYLFLLVFLIIACLALFKLSYIGQEIALKKIEAQKEVAIKCCEAADTTAATNGGAAGQGSEGDTGTSEGQQDEMSRKSPTCEASPSRLRCAVPCASQTRASTGASTFRNSPST